jgi:uncharacterized membrane protein
MAPLVVMLAAWVGLRLLGVVGALHAADSWVGALRNAFAMMFAFTGLSHFLPRTRPELVRMVPPCLPNPGLLVTVTGILEFLGAAGLLVPSLVSISAYALIALLVALFPANVYAARLRLPVGGRPAMSLSFRLPLQLVWIGALWWVARAGVTP